ncbi:hypothetical protein BDV96DRAFT_238930 [Lophiotrema nucula]|uniref:Secreted protein n=1 Tax=Lophiotrema nucula TaxID=690887 RepID=A0A6A5YR86_9PLEO|nr:hypothetical protein BDV96DRAFT_238930 [Lophiotrema nucula]
MILKTYTVILCIVCIGQRLPMTFAQAFKLFRISSHLGFHAPHTSTITCRNTKIFDGKAAKYSDAGDFLGNCRTLDNQSDPKASKAARQQR